MLFQFGASYNIMRARPAPSKTDLLPLYQSHTFAGKDTLEDIQNSPEASNVMAQFIPMMLESVTHYLKAGHPDLPEAQSSDQDAVLP